jgi:hypothetical protein
LGVQRNSKGAPSSAAEAKPSPSASLTILKGTLTPLVDQFNKDTDRLRVLALLSPT